MRNIISRRDLARSVRERIRVRSHKLKFFHLSPPSSASTLNFMIEIGSKDTMLILHRIQKAVTHSNVGVHCMRDGDILAAIQNFSAAFQLLKPALKNSSTMAALSKERIIMSTNDATISQLVLLNEDDDWKLLEEEGKKHIIMIYRNGILVSSSKCRLESYFEASSTSSLHRLNVLLTSIAIFNLAVAHHRYAMECAKGTRQMNHSLELAARLYESSFKLPRAASNLGDAISCRRRSDKCPLILILSMAILNNLGRVLESSSLNNQEQRAKKYCNQLRSTIAFLIDRQHSIMMKSQYRHLINIFLGVMSYFLSNDTAFALAPAAAA